MDANTYLDRIRGIANYQFGEDIGRNLFPDGVKISLSKRTGRIRHISFDETLLATLRPKDGFFSLTIEGARRLRSLIAPPRFRAVILEEIEEFVRSGRSVFARHVIVADAEIRPGEEVIVTNEEDEVLAVGKALLTGEEMLAFKKGVAIKVRRGVDKQ